MYVDSCIIVKLLTPEDDSAFFDEALTGQSLSCSELALTEVHSALLVKERHGVITPDERRMAWKVFSDWIDAGQLFLTPLNGITLRKANQILGHCHPGIPLRTLDALHLAACDLRQEFPMSTTDKRMRQAAVRLSIPIFPEA